MATSTRKTTHVQNSSSESEEKYTHVNIPDLFSSIMAAPPIVNPHYEVVKARCDAWIAEIVKADEKEAARLRKMDLGYLCAIWAPNCNEHELKLVVDWNNWVFLFDDAFDEGPFKANPIAGQEEVDRTMAIVDESEPRYTSPELHPVRYAFQTIWDRYKERGATKEMREQFKEAHRRSFEKLVVQATDQRDGRIYSRGEKEYIDMRRGTIGVFPAICVVAWAMHVELPSEVLYHPSLEEVMLVSTDIVHLVNDVLSYRKDLALGVGQTIIMVLIKQGMTPQQALDRIGELMIGCHKRWYTALAEMPVWGSNIDRQVLKFVEVCRNVALGNTWWSFRTERYLGKEGDEVIKTRKLRLLHDHVQQIPTEG